MRNHSRLFVYVICFFWGMYLLTMNSVMGQNQYKVTLKIEQGALAEHRGEPYYVTGNFNRWMPDDDTYKVIPNEDGSGEIVIANATAGLLEFKFTRGNWQTLDCTPQGKLVAPRNAMVHADTIIEVKLDAWRDDFPESTASPQVHLLDSAFYMPQLKQNRPVWIYLPKDYESNSRSYPVLYMHDGQDLFDEATSQGRIGPLEWGVDETIDAATNPCIVVAIAHHEDKQARIREYFVEPNSENSAVEGRAYLQFIVESLKPYIDSLYRTKAEKKYTAMAGSSMGGLLTFYAGLLYPDVFGALGVFSPSVWLDEEHIIEQIKGLRQKQQVHQQAYFFYAGGNENRLKSDGTTVKMHTDVITASDLLKETANPAMEIYINPEGRHGAWYWNLAFPRFYDWLIRQHKD